MDPAIMRLASEFAGNDPANLQIVGKNCDGLGTTYHEAGTM